MTRSSAKGSLLFAEGMRVRGAAIAQSLHAIANSTRRRGMVILISDLVEEPSQVMNALNHFRHNRNEVIVFNLFRPGTLRRVVLGERLGTRMGPA